MALECGFVARLGEETINTIAAYIAEAPAGFWFAAVHYLHGAVCRPTSDLTARPTAGSSVYKGLTF
jgi:hypothetical protein